MIFMVHVGKYAVHGSYELYLAKIADLDKKEFKPTLYDEGFSSLMLCLMEGARAKNSNLAQNCYT